MGGNTNTRQRRFHHKSREGCSTCKRRRVKCDEGRPECTRCVNSSHTCHYSSQGSELLLARNRELKSVVPIAAPHSPQGIIIRIPLVQPVADQTICWFSTDSGRELWTLWVAESCHLYDEGLRRLSETSPFLLHLCLALTLMHDLDLRSPCLVTSMHRSRVAFHWYHGTALFHQLLSQDVNALSLNEVDALRAAATLLASAAFAYLDAADPREAWPLSSGPLDLNWIKMGRGKDALWEKLSQRSSDDPPSIFAVLVNPSNMKSRIPDADAPVRWELLFPQLDTISGLSESSIEVDGPFYTVVSILSQISPEVVTLANFYRAFTFIRKADDRYKQLLEEKNSHALLLFACWYAKLAGSSVWWLSRRSKLEGAAICAYLEDHCEDDFGLLQSVAQLKEVFFTQSAV
ncbi:hypothetical protein BX600DRAFT_499107 [Xylariales sp. PMI_506]|nr:hypothetical protein BX600DRAFT_499107 [Xylariales sp. PMI_506]